MTTPVATWSAWVSTIAQRRSLVEVRATAADLERIRETLTPLLAQLSPHGWYPGTPDRAVRLPTDGLSLVYGGSMGDEIAVYPLDGDRARGFVRSAVLVRELTAIDARTHGSIASRVLGWMFGRGR